MTLNERIQQTFIDLIHIDEIYPNEKEVIAYTQKRLDEAGVAHELDSFRNIIAKVPGVGDAILLSTHLDIPEPLPKPDYTIDGDVIRSNGTGILGADPKTGLAVLIEFLIDIQKADSNTHAPIEVLLTRGEETGLHGAINADYDKLSAKIGVVLDEDGPVTQVVTRAPGFVQMDATFVGKIVHPREPEKGINALQMAAEAMMAVPCGYSTEGVTWNIGMFESGTARNSVPGTAKLKAEMRSFDTDLVVAEAKRITEVFDGVAQKWGGTLEMDWKLEFGGYHLEKNHPLFDRLEKTFTQMNLTPNYFETFGGTDANIFNSKGIMCVPLGSGYYNAHEYTEEANITEMAQIHEFLGKFVAVE